MPQIRYEVFSLFHEGVPSATTPDRLHLPVVLGIIEKELIVVTLKEVGGNVTHAAKLLGINRTTLFQKIKKYEL